MDIAAIRQCGERIGRDLRQDGIKGIRFHNHFQKALARAAADFGLRGWTECAAAYDGKGGMDIAGRVDVVWTAGRIPQVIFELDRTVKPESLRKLLLTDSPIKVWIYFGEKRLCFDRFLRKHDALQTIIPIFIRHRMVPQFR